MVFVIHNDLMAIQIMVLFSYTWADGRLQVGAEDETQLELEAIFFDPFSGNLPKHGRCLVHPSRCQLTCSI